MKRLVEIVKNIAIAALLSGLLFIVSSTAMADDETETSIANIPTEELPGAEDKEVPEVDVGRKCKRIRKTGSNRITRVCTTRAQREEARSASNEFLREQQLDQETYMIQNANEGGVSPN